MGNIYNQKTGDRGINIGGSFYKTKKLTSNNVTFPKSFIFMGIVIFLVFIIFVGGQSYPKIQKYYIDNYTNFCSEPEKIGILVLPFYPYTDNSEITNNYQQSIIDILNELSTNHEMPINIKGLSSLKYYPGGDTKKALELAKKRCAEIVIWGSYDESVSPAIPEIKFAFTNPKFFKGAFDVYEKAGFKQSSPFDLKTGITFKKGENLAYLIGSIASYENGDFKSAKELLLKVSLNDLGSSCESLNNYLDWAGIYWYLGSPIESEKLTVKAMKIAEDNICDRIHKINLLDQMSNIYSRYHKDQNEAHQYSKSAIEIAKTLEAGQDSLLGFLLTNSAGIYNYEGNYKEGLDQQKKALMLYKSATVIHENLLISSMLYNIANMLHGSGEYENALKYCDSAIIMQYKILPSFHESIAKSYSLKSKINLSLGHNFEAIKLQKKALKIREHILPENHIFLATSYHNLASTQNRNYIDIYGSLEYEHKAIKIYNSLPIPDKKSLALAHKELFFDFYDDFGHY